MSEDGETVTFETKRKLDTGDAEQDYLVPLGEEIDMVWAIHEKTGEWKEHTKYGNFKVTYDQSLGNLLPDASGRVKITAPNSTEELECYRKNWDRYNLDACFDPSTQELVFLVDIPNDSWLAIGLLK